MNKFVWLLKQVIPLKYKTKYKTPDGVKHIAIWRMWFGKVFNYTDITV